MNTPKSLPWHARKAGVSIERAEALWAQAVREATAETGWVGNSEYWGAAMDRFQDLLVTEPARYCSPQMENFVRTQQRMWLLPLLAAEDMWSAMAANWRHFRAQLEKAA